MSFRSFSLLCVSALALMACTAVRRVSLGKARDAGSDSAVNGNPDTGPGDGDGDAPDSGDGDGDTDSGAGDSGNGDGDGDINDILSRLGDCTPVSGVRFSTDKGAPKDIPICSLKGALFWHADMDIDCSGERTDHCNEDTDDGYENETTGKGEDGMWLTADELPFVVVPSISDDFDYTDYDIDIGTVIAVIYKDRLEYGVFGDSGPEDLIGEASYAMAKRLNVNPDPKSGGVDKEDVWYIAFQGATGMVSPIDDTSRTESLGATLMKQLLQQNP